jgi:hypothetical protein
MLYRSWSNILQWVKLVLHSGSSHSATSGGSMASSEMLCSVVLTRATRRAIPEDAILHSHRRENLKCYIVRFPCNSAHQKFVISGLNIPVY